MADPTSDPAAPDRPSDEQVAIEAAARAIYAQDIRNMSTRRSFDSLEDRMKRHYREFAAAVLEAVREAHRAG